MPQFFAALNSGADAVYLGLKQFNARARASNFELDELRAIAPIARAHDMKILVTLNILIKQFELRDLIQLLIELQTCDIHAVIVQDVGLVRLIRSHFPDLRIHASTQMAIHNPAGVIQAADWGIQRAVLARELTAQELRLIRAAVPPETIELEAFCHGSLCYSYSGLCFFSGIGDGRSGNRGECAYTCREPYRIVSESGHGFLFSMGDLDTSDSIAKFVETGVHTLKIEGRKKDAQYVSSVVRLYRKKLDQYFARSTLRASAPDCARELPEEAEIRDDLSYSFQRKTTSFFFNGRYHENVIDLSNPTHLGNLAGTVERIDGGWAELITAVELELHDGLKIVPTEQLYHAKPQHGDSVNVGIESTRMRYDNREIQFGLSDLRIGGRRAFTAKAGERVAIKLPSDLGRIELGWQVRKVRSTKLRTQTDSLSRIQQRMVSRHAIHLDIHASVIAGAQPRLELIFSARIGDERIFSAPFSTSEFELAHQRDLQSIISEHFRVFGDSQIAVVGFGWLGEMGFAISPKQIKSFKRQFEVDLKNALASWRNQRPEFLANAIAPTSRPPISNRSLVFAVKIDRIEYLAGLRSHHLTGGTVQEVVFEPKRAMMGQRPFQSILEELRDFSNATGSRIRFAIPSIVRLWDETLLKRWVACFLEQGFTAFEIGNVGGFALLKQFGVRPEALDIATDFSCYALNHLAVEQWAAEGVRQIALSIEDDRASLTATLKQWPDAAVDPQLIVYKDSPLFIAEACSLTALHNGCPTAKVCGYRTLEIENSQKERFFVAHESCRSIVYGKRPFSLSDRWRSLVEAGLVRHVRADFLTRPYSDQDIATVMSAVFHQQRLPETHQGNFDGVLL
jgi:putative protease